VRELRTHPPKRTSRCAAAASAASSGVDESTRAIHGAIMVAAYRARCVGVSLTPGGSDRGGGVWASAATLCALPCGTCRQEETAGHKSIAELVYPQEACRLNFSIYTGPIQTVP
jgi:hypothetical protein